MATKKYASIAAITELWTKAKLKFVEKFLVYDGTTASIDISAGQSLTQASLEVSNYDTGLNSNVRAGDDGVNVTSTEQVMIDSADQVTIAGLNGVTICDYDSQTSNGVLLYSPYGGVAIYDVIAPTSNDMAANKGYVDSAIPTAISSFTNDAGYLTLATLPVYNGSYSQVNS